MWALVIQALALFHVGICLTVACAAALTAVGCVCGNFRGLYPTCHLRGGLDRVVGVSKAGEQTEQSAPESGRPPSGAAPSRGPPGHPPVGGQELLNLESAVSSRVGGRGSERLREVPETIRAC